MNPEDRKTRLGNEPVGRLLMRLSAPAVVGMVVMGLYNIIDTIFIGQFVGPEGIAGVTISYPIQGIIFGLAQLVGVGSASIISRALGAGDQEKANNTAGVQMTLTLILSSIVTLGGLWFMDPLLRLFGVTPDIYTVATDYLSINLCGAVFAILAISSNNIIRSEGNTRVAMTAMILGAVINVIFDYILIVHVHLGVKGAALATIFSQACMVVYQRYYFRSGKSLLRVKLLGWNPKIAWESISIGFSAFSMQVGGFVIMTLMLRILSQYGSTQSLAVYGIINRVMMFIFMPTFGFFQGMMPIIGFNYGAGKARRARDAMFYTMAICTSIITVGYIGIQLVPGMLIKVFTNDAAILAEGIPAIRLVTTLIPIVGLQFPVVGACQSLGKALLSALLSLSRQMLLLLPCLLILPPLMGIDGLWISFPIADGIAFLFTTLTLFWILRQLKLREAMDG